MSEAVATPPPTPARAGAELVRASQVFAKEDRARTWRLLVSTIAVFAALEAGALLAPWAVVQVACGLVAGLVVVRLFIFYHDHLHGAVLADSTAGRAIMVLVGLHTLNPPSIWKDTHDYHHRHNAKMMGADIGSFPVATVEGWREKTAGQQRMYAFARHPVNMLVGYVTIFTLGMCVFPFLREPKRHWGGVAALVLHYGLFAAVAVTSGLADAVIAVSLPVALASAVGGYMFYAQHNFPSIELRDRQSWEFSFAALRSSSMFDMSPLMHWFTGNIGYHHVHHLNHRIPFYRLPEVMAAMPELQNPGRTSWRPGDVLACLRLKLWDPDRNRMIGWNELPSSS